MFTTAEPLGVSPPPKSDSRLVHKARQGIWRNRPTAAEVSPQVAPRLGLRSKACGQVCNNMLRKFHAVTLTANAERWRSPFRPGHSQAGPGADTKTDTK
jgi:hypothetical protein